MKIEGWAIIQQNLEGKWIMIHKDIPYLCIDKNIIEKEYNQCIIDWKERAEQCKGEKWTTICKPRMVKMILIL